MTAETEALVQIARDLAACDPPLDGECGECVLCQQGGLGVDAEAPSIHAPACPWRRAVETLRPIELWRNAHQYRFGLGGWDRRRKHYLGSFATFDEAMRESMADRERYTSGGMTVKDPLAYTITDARVTGTGAHPAQEGSDA